MSLISDLHYLGYSFDVESLDALNKKELLRNISQNLGNMSNVKVMAAVCMTYEIYNLKYWELIMKEANKHNLVRNYDKKSLMFWDVMFFFFFLVKWNTGVSGIFNACCDVCAEKLLQRVLAACNRSHVCQMLEKQYGKFAEIVRWQYACCTGN